LVLAFAIFVAILISPVCAQSLEDRLRDQLRSTLNELHQVQDQQTALEAAKAAAQQERDALKAQLTAARSQLAHAGQGAANSHALEAEITKYKDAYAQAAGNAQQAQAEHDKLQSGLTDAQKQLGLCQDKNTALLKLGNEILSAYEDFDVVDAAGANEPFIGVKRVELENIAQGFGDRLHDGKFDPRATHASPSAGGGH
jgi:chromosome segregation ATPase